MNKHHNIFKAAQPRTPTRSMEELWNASRKAEKNRDISLALELHAHILKQEKPGYLALFRAGWLHYQAGGFNQALHFYKRASEFPESGRAPLEGIRNCLIQMGYMKTNPKALDLLQTGFSAHLQKAS